MDKRRELDGLKGYPAQLAPTLSCLLAVQDRPEESRWGDLVDCLRVSLPQLAKSEGVDVDNLISAQSLYTLRKLDLIEGRHEQTRLRYYGWYLARLASREIEFKQNFAAILVEIDAKKFGLIAAAKEARRYPGEAIPLHALALSLARTKVDPCQSFEKLPDAARLEFQKLGLSVDGHRSRLSDTLRFYNYADVLRRSDGTVTLLDSTLERAKRIRTQMVRPDIRKEEFFRALLDEYELQVRRGGSPFLPMIPNLREPICKRLSIDDEMFKSFLLSLVPSYGNYKILLSPPSGAMPTWQTIRRDNNRYYYLSIYSRDTEGK